MGSWETLCATIRPEEVPVETVVEDLREFCQKNRQDLPTLPEELAGWFPPAEDPEYENFQRDRLRVESDATQAYLGGQSWQSAVVDAWEQLLVAEGIGDGLLAVVRAVEVENQGFGWMYEYREDGYRVVTGERLPTPEGELVDTGEYGGEPLGRGALVAQAFAREWDVRPARFVENTFVTMDEEAFVPRSYRRER